MAPNTAPIKGVITDALTILGANGSILVPQIQMYDSEDSAEAAYRSGNADKGLGIIFADGNLDSLSYTVRVPYDATPSVDDLYDDQGRY